MVSLKNMLRCLVVVGLLAFVSTAIAGNVRGIRGKRAPKWSVNQWLNLPPGKKTIETQDFRGKALYLFFFQSWCPGCHSRGFPTLQRVMSRFKDNKDVAFVAIQTVFEGFSSNTFAHAKRVAQEFKLTIPIGQSGALGKRSEVMARYRSGGTPWVVIIDRSGVVKYNDFHIDVEHADRIIRAALKSPPTEHKNASGSSSPDDG